MTSMRLGPKTMCYEVSPTPLRRQHYDMELQGVRQLAKKLGEKDEAARAERPPLAVSNAAISAGGGR